MVLSQHLSRGLKKPTENICKDSWFLGQDLNPGPSEYEAKVKWNSVSILWFIELHVVTDSLLRLTSRTLVI
jgi:hypothetical protein